MAGMFLVLRARILAQSMVKVNRANNHDMWVTTLAPIVSIANAGQ
jgi:hypothetical protein